MPDKNIFIDAGPKDPDLKMSPFDLSFTSNMTGRFGRVNVSMCKYFPPKSDIEIDPAFAFDMQALVFPIQTNVRCHLKFYQIPLRILQKNFQDFCCQLGTDGQPVNSGSQQISVPFIKRPTGWNAVGSLAEQIGCCNLRLVDVVGVQNLKLDTSFIRNDSSEHLVYDEDSRTFETLIEGEFRRGICQIPTGHTLTNYDDGTRQYCATYFLDTRSGVGTGITSNDKAVISAYRKSSNDDFTIFDSVTLDYSTNPNFVSPCFYLGDFVTSTINGFSIRRYPLYCFIPSSHSFLAKIAALVSSGESVYIAFGCTAASSNLSLAISPNLDFDGRSRSVTFNVYSSDKYTEVSGDITSTSHLQRLVSQLGLANYCRLSTLSVGKDITTIYDSVNNANPVKPIDAYAFRAYEFIHNYFPEFRNSRVAPFMKGGKPTYNQFITNDGDGADTTTPVEHFNALYEVDYFTSCVKEPQFGNAPLVGVTVNDMSDTGILTFDESGTSNNYTVEIPIDKETGQALPISMYKDIADKPNVHRLQELIKMGISINDLRNVSTFQRMLERMQRAFSGGSPYKNLIYEFFGTNPPIGDHFPRYLGGITRNISVDKITQSMDTEVQGKVKKAGEFAGQGWFRYPANGEKPETIKTFTTEPCLIMALQYFTVTPTYSQYLPKHLTYKDPLDFYLDPDFAYVGPQPVFKYELAAAQLDAEHIDDVFGYNRPYAEMFSNVDEVHGLFKTDMANFLLQRFFGAAPELNQSFIEINSKDLLNIFSVVQDEDKIYGQVHFKIKGQLPAPRSYQARSI